MVSLYDTIEDLIHENDRRCENDDGDVDVTLEFVFHLHLPILTYLFDTSQDRLEIGYIALNNAIPWFQRKAADMENEVYTHMLKKVRFASINDYIHTKSLKLLFSLGRERTVLEETIPRSSRSLSLIGSIASGSLTPRSTPKTNTAVDLLATPVADYSAQQS